MGWYVLFLWILSLLDEMMVVHCILCSFLMPFV